MASLFERFHDLVENRLRRPQLIHRHLGEGCILEIEQKLRAALDEFAGVFQPSTTSGETEAA